MRAKGIGAAGVGAVVGATLGFHVISGLAALITAIIGAAVVSNLSLLVLDIWTERAASGGERPLRRWIRRRRCTWSRPRTDRPNRVGESLEDSPTRARVRRVTHEHTNMCCGGQCHHSSR